MSDIRFLFSSGYGDIVDTQEYAGEIILTKPFTLAQLQRALQESEAPPAR